jgi:sarcosine oxidase subunit delta
VPSAYWFIAERNTLTDEIVRTYPADELFVGPPRTGGP